MGRMIHGGERHPLQVMAILHNHYGRLARLDGADAHSEAEAASAMGIKPGYPAKKALGNYRRLGGGGVQRAVQLLAKAEATTFAEEAEAFTAKAQELMAAHAIQQAMLEAGGDMGILSGRIRKAFLTKSRVLTSPSPSMFAGRVSMRITWVC